MILHNLCASRNRPDAK